MKEIFDLSFSPANVFPTILLLFVVLYWVVFLFGMLDLSFMDIEVGGGADVDADVDIGFDKDIHIGHDMDVDVDHDIDVDAGKDIAKDFAGQGQTPSGGFKILHFLNLGDIPFMIFFSFFALFYWAAAILGNHYLAIDGGALMVAGVLTGGFVLSLLLAKLFTQPMRKLFREMGKGDELVRLVGKLCTLELSVEGNRLGQAVVVAGDKHMLINVRSENGDRIPSGVRCLIVEREPDSDIFRVQRFEIEESIT